MISKRQQPETIPKLVKTGDADPFAYLRGSKDQEKIQQLILEADKLNEEEFDLKQICAGILTSEM